MSATRPPEDTPVIATSYLRERLATGRVLLVPGTYDAVTGLIAERAGFEALYLSGAAVAYT